MNTRRFGTALAFSFAALAIAGCGEDKPSDKVASAAIRKIADSDTTEGMEVANFKRDNGQVDPDSANRYKVTYTYDLRLTKPLPEVVLANAVAIHNSWGSSAKRETGAFFDATRMGNDLTKLETSMAVNQWIQNQDGNFAARRDEFLTGCAPCVTFWNSEDAPQDAKSRRSAFISSWIYFEDLGFKDKAKVGDSVPRYAWSNFSKTEKGWQAN